MRSAVELGTAVRRQAYTAGKYRTGEQLVSLQCHLRSKDILLKSKSITALMPTVVGQSEALGQEQVQCQL